MIYNGYITRSHFYFMLKKTLFAVIVAATSTQVLAWGDREQGILSGIVLTQIFRQPVQVQPQPILIPQPLERPSIQPRIYSLPQPRPVYEERIQWEPSCNCYTRVYNQIGWQ